MDFIQGKKDILNLILKNDTNIDDSDISINKITQNSGSDRVYYRVSINNKSYIAVCTSNIKEAESYIYLSKVFKEHNFNVPEIFQVSDDKSVYLIQDLGDISLFDILSKRDNSTLDNVLFDYCIKSLEHLAKLQFNITDKIDYSECYPVSEFDCRSVKWDLNYFKYCLVKPLNIDFFEPDLEDDFDEICNILNNIKVKGFMYRDFQSRNIMIHDDKPWFIDFQGGRYGPVVYDAVSFIYQAKAGLTDSDKKKLLDVYFNEVNKYVEYSREQFDKDILSVRLVRALQTLGAYGFRGLIEKKRHFLDSLIPGIFNLYELLKIFDEIDIQFKSINYIANALKHYADELVSHDNKVHQSDKLTIYINSFSYLYGSIPTDSLHGGGFVFDCRGLPNPYWIEDLRMYNGTQDPIINYLEKQVEVKDFLNNVINILDSTINRYISRDFKYLSVSFGCSGGKHRSVYCADKLMELLKEKYDVDVEVTHLRSFTW